MKRLIINKLYILSVSEKKGKVINFTTGINVITSSKNDGNKKGKSVILKSIYHTLGADCYFEDMWDVQKKTFIIDFTIDDEKYYIYRYDKLFKIFSEDLKLLFKTIDRTELSEFLLQIYNFSVSLPSRDNNKLELAPPAFSYLLNFIDQDKMNGTYFTSFKSLSQYPNFKENVLYSHFGVFNSEYYNLIKDLDVLKEKERNYNAQKELLDKMIIKTIKEIEDISYSKNIDTLQIEIENSKEEYSNITNRLNEIKNTLINLRNQKQQLLTSIKEIKSIDKDIIKGLKSVNNHTCPLCNSVMEDNLEYRLNKYNSMDDLLLLNDEFEISILEINKEIEKQEEIYKQTLDLLDKYESKLKINSKEVNDVLKHKGFIEVKDSLLKELSSLKLLINDITLQIEEKNKIKKVYDKKKKDINNKYCELMIADKQRFALNELDSKNFENIKSVFNAGGSNKPIATIIWYFNLLRVKMLFNSEAIRFPLILDSPNNVELDEINRKVLFDYLFSNIDENTQLVISTLGFNKEDYPDFIFSNIIELTNEKYKLLNEKEYNENKDFMFSLSNID